MSTLINRQIELESGELALPMANCTESVSTKEPTSMLSMIAEAARDPRVDAAKLRELWELKKSIDADEARIAFNRAMVACQLEIKPVVRDAWNDHTKSKYARLETIDRAIRPIYSRYGFAFTFSSPGETTDGVTISGLLLHREGHSEPYRLSGQLDLTGPKGSSNKTSIQGLGSTASYLRRYLQVMAFNVPLENEDNDGSPVRYLDVERKNKILDLIIGIRPADPQVEKHFVDLLGIKDLDHIPERQFALAMNMLQAKYRKVKGG